MRSILCWCLLILPLSVYAEVRTEVIEWTVDETTFSGHLVYAEGGSERPGVVMVPNWMGVNASALDKARTVAASGYVVLLADVYGKDVRPADVKEAGAASGKAFSDRPLLRRRIAAAVDLLKAQAGKLPLDADRIAAIGFCFGGSVVLELARSGYDLDAVVSLHGGLGTDLPAQEAAVKASVLVLNGADDTYVKPEEIRGFEDEMRKAGADWQFVNFSGAVHCFAEADANRPPGCVYHERSAQRAYRMLYAHLAEAFATTN